MKQIYVVLGMPRSGTSAITRALGALGIQLGDHLQPADSRNRRGFYEDIDVVYKIHRGLAKAWDQEWMDLDMDVKCFETDPVLRDYKNYAIGLVCERLASSQTWGFKDPRTLNILPFWQSVFKAVNAEDRYVIAVRHPLSAAHSFQKFDHADLELGLILWIKKLFYALEGSQGKARVLVSYEEMLRDPRRQLFRMHAALQLATPLDAVEVDCYANDFIDKKLKHYECTDEELHIHQAAAVAPICIKLHAFAMKLARDEIKFDTKLYAETWQELKNEIAKSLPVFDYIESLSKKNRMLERKIRVIKKSLPYKLIYPLRVIDDLLRMKRRKMHRKLVLTNES